MVNITDRIKECVAKDRHEIGTRLLTIFRIEQEMARTQSTIVFDIDLDGL